MTRNQIEFLKHLETKRANQATETEAKRANLERERQGVISLDETSRHNLATEQHNANVLLENTRHNQVTEAEFARHNQATELLTSAQLSETKRANLAREELTFQANTETKRANRARERETERANRAIEQWRADSLDETYRHNRQSEKLQSQSVTETRRANLAREEISYSQLGEQRRANQAQEQLRRQQHAETERYNREVQRQRDLEIAERERANRANEVLQGARNITSAGQLAEDVYHHRKQEAETMRHNMATEAIYATKDFGTKLTVEGSTTTFNPTVNSSQAPIEIALSAGGQATRKQITDGKPAPTNGSNQARVVGRSVTPAYEGFTREISNFVTGNSIQFVTERYSDGSIKYYQEELRHGKVVSRKQVSQSQFRRGTREN